MANDKNRANFGNLDDSAAVEILDDGVHTDEPGTVLLREERVVAGTEKVRSSLVRVRVKVVTEEKTITVPLRRQVLEIIETDENPDDARGATGLKKAREIVLHEERVAVELVPYERVRLTRRRVRDDVVVETDVAREVLEVDGVEPTRP